MAVTNAPPSARARVRRTVDFPADVADRLAELAEARGLPMARVIADALATFAALPTDAYQGLAKEAEAAGHSVAEHAATLIQKGGRRSR